MKTYHITELGRHFSLSRSTLLYYDKIGLLSPGGRTYADYRLYSQEDFARLERICCFREAGLSLSEIATLLDSHSDSSSILESRLRETGREIAALRSQQRLLIGMLKTVSSGPEASGLDKELWLSLQKVCGLDETAIKRWHIEFERRAPDAHHDFLLSLGLNEKEAIQVRMLTKNMEENKMSMKFFYELFEDLPRQGPGCTDATLRALALIKDLPPKPRVLDIGCGCGMQTQILAEQLNTPIIAIDNHRPVLDHLDQAAAIKNLTIETHEMSMFDMPFDKESFDLLWSEGSIFIIGLARGLKDFITFIKSGGYLAFTEMCWFSDNPPEEIRNYFGNIYPDMKTADEVSRMAIDSGYSVVDSFKLPESAWWDDYYTPMLERMKELKIKNAGVTEAEAVYSNCEIEAEMFRKHHKSYGYVFFVLQKI